MTVCYQPFLLLLLGIFSGCESLNQEGFYAIAHMTHTKQAIRLAMDSGANALELDLNFDKVTGEPTRFYHGSPCDCSCYKIASIFSFTKSGGNLCMVQKKPCESTGQYNDILNEMVKYSERLALIYIDCKITDFSESLQKKAARHTVQMLSEDLFLKGYRGKVVVTSARDKFFLRSLANCTMPSLYKSRIFFSLDWNNKGIDDTLKFLTSLPTQNIVFSQGNSVCHPASFHRVVRIASANKMSGVLSQVFVWTIDITKSYRIYYSFGARGMITNRIGALMKWVRENNIKLATPGDSSLTPALNKKPILNPKCGCRYSNGGCVLAQLPPPNTACQCQKTITHCSGRVIMCTDPNSLHCKHPVYTQQTCLQGRGNCDGYINQKCDCKYSWWRGGCVVSAAAPIHSACRCHKHLFRCHGHVVSCKETNSLRCTMPDKSEESCELGGGDCAGY